MLSLRILDRLVMPFRMSMNLIKLSTSLSKSVGISLDLYFLDLSMASTSSSSNSVQTDITYLVCELLRKPFSLETSSRKIFLLDSDQCPNLGHSLKNKGTGEVFRQCGTHEEMALC